MPGKTGHNQDIKRCGYFVIITSVKMTAAQALDTYKGRDVSERFFKGNTSYLGNKSYRVHTNESIRSNIY